VAGELPGVTVSFMGEGGRIVASSARERLGDLHEGAARVMRGEVDEFEVTAEAAAGSATMREGVSRPIVFEGRRVACLALAAPLAVARTYANVVRHWVLSSLRAKREEERRREHLVQVEQQFREVLEFCPAALSVTDEDGKLVFHNKRLREIMRYPEEEIDGIDTRRFWADLRERERAISVLRSRGGQIRDQEVCYKTRDGEPVSALVSYTQMAGRGDRISFAGASRVAWIYDVTELKRAEAALRERTASVGLLQAVAVAANEAATAEEACGSAWGGSAPTPGGPWDTSTPSRRTDRRARPGGRVAPRRPRALRAVPRGDRGLTLRLGRRAARPSPGERQAGLDGRPLQGSRLPAREGRGRGRHQGRLRFSRAGRTRGRGSPGVLRGRGSRAGRAAARADGQRRHPARTGGRARAGRGRAASGQGGGGGREPGEERVPGGDEPRDQDAHDGRARHGRPARGGGPAGEGEGRVEAIRVSGRHLLSVIDDILDFSRIEAGRLELERTDFPLADVPEQVRSIMAPQAAERGLELRFTYGGHVPPVVRGDPTRLAQVLLNLVGNALKFTHEGGVAVAVSSRPEGEGRVRLRFEVRDTGIGMTPGQAAGLFQAFAQADRSTTRRYGGTGSGWRSAGGWSRPWAGEIGVESAPGGGQPVLVRGPARGRRRGGRGRAGRPRPGLGAAAAPPRGRGRGGEPGAAAGDARPPRPRGRLRRERRRGGRAGRAERFDAVLMDVRMPVMDGVEATRRIRALPPPAGRVPIVRLTANVVASERERYLAAGMDACLAKPVDWGRLFAVLARLGEDPARAAEPSRASPGRARGGSSPPRASARAGRRCSTARRSAGSSPSYPPGRGRTCCGWRSRTRRGAAPPSRRCRPVRRSCWRRRTS
jgi:PAS domain S-box-containing protein